MEKEWKTNQYNKMEQRDNRAIVIERVLQAPADLVWSVWTNPGHIAKWWGPAGFTNTIHAMDTREGGEWKLTMHGPDGKDYANRSRFMEIVPLRKIVFEHYNPDYIATIIFKANENKTHMEWVVEFKTPELYDTVVRVFRADEGLEQNVEKLENYLEQIS
jgi:uncharacterized protein YndB with AHSA1/START domain